MEFISFKVQRLSSLIRDEFDTYYMTLAIRDAESGPAGGLSKCSHKRLFAFSNEPNTEMSAVKEENESS